MISISISDFDASTCAYLTASFPSLTPPKNIAYSVFVREEDEGKEFVKRPSTLAGETETVEFSGSVNEGSDGLGSRFGSLLVCRVIRQPIWSADTSSPYINRGHLS
jgi:hypothetical protein